MPKWLETLTGRKVRVHLEQLRAMRPPSPTDREAELLDMLDRMVNKAAENVVQARARNNELWQMVIEAKQLVDRRKNLRDPDIKL